MSKNSNQFATEQESFWAGDFGNEYIDRNKDVNIQASKKNFFSNALQKAKGVNNMLEFGSNIGLNLRAIKEIIPSLSATAVEINVKAAETLKALNYVEVNNTSIFEFSTSKKFDLVLCCGILIHINPEFLDKVYTKAYEACGKYILFAEYYNPSPVQVPYRGNTDKLFKRDFAGEIMDKYPSLKLVDYGFVYHRDPKFPLDDINWFLMEKTA